jgi:hypothetical protein
VTGARSEGDTVRDGRGPQRPQRGRLVAVTAGLALSGLPHVFRQQVPAGGQGLAIRHPAPKEWLVPAHTGTRYGDAPRAAGASCMAAAIRALRRPPSDPQRQAAGR